MRKFVVFLIMTVLPISSFGQDDDLVDVHFAGNVYQINSGFRAVAVDETEGTLMVFKYGPKGEGKAISFTDLSKSWTYSNAGCSSESLLNAVYTDNSNGCSAEIVSAIRRVKTIGIAVKSCEEKGNNCFASSHGDRASVIYIAKNKRAIEIETDKTDIKGLLRLIEKSR